MEKYLRTFIGLPFCVDQNFLLARHRLMTTLEGERISWVDPSLYHVTLRFLGDTRLSLIQEIGRVLRAELRLPQSTSLKVTGLGSFGPRKKPRVIWVGFDGAVFFGTLKMEVDRVLQMCGILPVQQPFRAHLTLGRVRGLLHPERYEKAMEQMKMQFDSRISFEKLVYFRSTLGSGGPEYTALEELQFRQDLKPSGSPSIHHPS